MQVHGTAVALDGRALLITGAPGTGKSSLALDLVALGAVLVADDRVDLTAREGTVLAAPPPALAGLIEARSLGVLRLPHAAPVPVMLVLDLDEPEPLRLPVRRSIGLLGCPLPRILRPEPLRPSALWAVLRHGLPLDPEAPNDPRHESDPRPRPDTADGP